MINNIKNFLNNLDTPTAINYAKSYFNVSFSEEEMKKILPLLADCCDDYLNPETKELFINRITAATNESTAKKTVKIMDYLAVMYRLV